MPTRVLSGPASIVTPADIVGSHDDGDPRIGLMIEAVQAEIDGPTGWLGRALGKQKLEFTTLAARCGVIRLLQPVIRIVSITYVNRDGVSSPLMENAYSESDGWLQIRVPADADSQSDAVRIVYEAGYDGEPIEDGGTGPVPANAKQAVILIVQHMKALSAEQLFLRSEEVEGVGTFQYTVSEKAGEIIRSAADRLLQGLRLYI